MALKTLIGKSVIIALSLCSMSAFAANQQIKCPSVDYVKENFSNKLSGVFRLGPNVFSVKNNKQSSVVDEKNNLLWRIDVGTITKRDYDFNEAYKNAPNELAKVAIVDTEYMIQSQRGGFCQYSDKAGRQFLVLTGGNLKETMGHPLTISNQTKSPLTFTINNTCSEEIGTVKEIETKNISKEVLSKICHNYTQPCTITAYYGKHCAGKPVGGMKYNSEHNFEVQAYDNGVSVTAREDLLVLTSPVL